MFLRHKFSFLLIILAQVIVLTLPGYAQTDPAGMILFVSNDGTGSTIQAMDAKDTTVVQTLISPDFFASNDILDISSPIPSPDGSQIAFTGFLNSGDFEIFVYNFAEDTLRNVSNASNALDIDPSWHPDGDALLFASDRDGTDFDIWQVTLSEPPQLTIIFESDCNDRDPARSPDGLQLALARSPGFSNAEDDSCPAGSTIWVRATDDEDPVAITSGEKSDDSSPVWSPDGTRLAYIADSTNTDIFMADLSLPAGENTRNITGSNRNESNPSWSPDGNQIVYTIISTDTRAEIFQITVDDQSSQPLALSPAVEGSLRSPVWTTILNDCTNLSNCDIASPAVSTSPGTGRQVEPGACQYIVQAGENFFRIGLRHGYRVSELQAHNTHLGNIRRIHPGNIINIPDCSRPSLE